MLDVAGDDDYDVVVFCCTDFTSTHETQSIKNDTGYYFLTSKN